MELIRKLWARVSDVRTPDEVKDLCARRAVQAAEIDLITAEAHLQIARKKLEQRAEELGLLWRRNDHP